MMEQVVYIEIILLIVRQGRHLTSSICIAGGCSNSFQEVEQVVQLVVWFWGPEEGCESTPRASEPIFSCWLLDW